MLEGIGYGYTYISNPDLCAFYYDAGFVHAETKMTAFFLFLVSSGMEHFPTLML